MRSSIVTALLGAALASIAIFITMGKQTPTWTGPFTGKRIIVQKETDPSL